MIPGRLKSLFGAYLPYFHIGIILLLGVAAYANSFGVPLQLDDRSTIRVSLNPSGNLYTIHNVIHNTRWFADLTFALNRAWHGEQVPGYHLANLAIHLTAAACIYLLVHSAITALKQTYCLSRHDDCYKFLQHFIPFATAALFVCHPVQTQAVTYISQRYTSLATLLYISSIFSYLQVRLELAVAPKKSAVWLWALASILAALLAMRSKEIAFTLPLMIVVLEIALFRGQLLKQRIFQVLTAGLFLIIPLQLICASGMASSGNLLDQLQLATSETHNITRHDYALTQFRVVATYLRLLVLPINQNLEYDYPVSHSLFDRGVIDSLVLHITVAGMATVLFIRSKRCFTENKATAGITLRLASLGIVWFYLALSVESSVIPIYDVIFEHRLYLPSVGFFMAAAAVVSGFIVQRQRWRKYVWSATLLLCCALTAATIARNRIWSDELVMWQDVVSKSPNKARVNYNIGYLYFKKYLPERALPYLVRAIEIDATQEKYWDILNSVMPLLGGFEGRYAYGREFHLVEPELKNAWLANSFNNLGLAHEHLGNLSQARHSFLKAVKFTPNLDLAWYNLTLVAARLSDSSTVTSSLQTLRTLNAPLAQHAATIISVQKTD